MLIYKINKNNMLSNVRYVPKHNTKILTTILRYIRTTLKIYIHL
jgi:hypothetical protein